MFRFLIPLLCMSFLISQDMWINEIHYDNYDGDEGEFIEVAVSSDVSNLSSITVSLYNGNNSSTYNSVTLSDFTVGSTSDGFTFYYYDFPANGIQNGGSDGIALDNGGSLIQFLSYEGTLTASDGAASGTTSTDIGVSEPGDIGHSLQLQGIGTTYESFSWVGPIEATKGNVNTNQILGNSGTITGCTDDSAVNYNPAATEDDGSCIYPTEMSIYDIQFTAEQGEYCYETPHAGEFVTTTGIVTAVVPGNPTFYIQDFSFNSYAGIYVYDNSYTPTVGDEVSVTGMVNEYYSFSQIIDLTHFEVLSSGNELTVTDITTDELANGCTESGESLEGMLVRVSNVSVTTAPNEYNEWYVDDGSGPCQIDDGGGSPMFDGEWPLPGAGDSFPSITGVVDYSYSTFGILPRYMSDIGVDNTLPTANAGDDISVSPGGTVTLDGSGSFDGNGSIISYEWVQLSGTPVSLSDEEAVSTTFIAPDETGELVFRLTVWDNDINEDSDEISVTVIGSTSIYDIQYTTEQGDYCYETLMSQQSVSTSGVVTHVKPGENPNFFLQDPNGSTWSGIYVYDNTIAPQVGDELQISGTVNEYYSFTQIIDVTASTVLSSDNHISPQSLTCADIGYECSEQSEQYESMLVKLTNVTFDSVDEHGNWMVSDGTGTSMIDDYYFDGTFPSLNVGDTFECVTGVVGYSYGEFKIYPRNADDFTCDDSGCVANGDVNGDNVTNILDVVQVVNFIMGNLEFTDAQICAANMNGDAGLNVLDIVQIVNIILEGRIVSDASTTKVLIEDNKFIVNANGYIGGVELVLSHSDDFELSLSESSLVSQYNTNGNKTHLIVVQPENNEIFSYSGEFIIDEMIIANSQSEVSVEYPKSYSISAAFPNPFNPQTSVNIELNNSAYVSMDVYNLMGQKISNIVNSKLGTGLHQFMWDAQSFSSGTYLIQVSVDGQISTQKIVLVK